MAREYDLVWCDGCGLEILWAPVRVGGRDYCCQDCLDGLPCECGERLELDEGRRAHAEGQPGYLAPPA